MKRENFEPTPEQLLLAFLHLRRPGWPATLEEALRDHVRTICIRGLAKSMSRPQFGGYQSVVPRTLAGAPPVPPTPTQAPQRQAATLSAAARNAKRFDAKRAAANDRDDD